MRLTNEDRDGVVSRAIKARFAEPRQAVALEKEELASKLYDLAFPKTARDWVAKDPGSRWLHKGTSLRFNLSGHRVTLNLREKRPLPHDSGYKELAVIANDDLRDANTALDQRSARIDEESEAAEAQLRGLLSRVTTLNKLREVWPEGEPFYAHLAPRERIVVPAVQVADINKLLGLAT